MEALLSPFRGLQPLPDAREEPAEPLVVEPQTDAHAKPSASLDATPENMSMLNTPDNGAPNGAATTHRGQVAPSASHIFLVFHDPLDPLHDPLAPTPTLPRVLQLA